MQFTGFDVSLRAMSIEVAAELKASSIFSADVASSGAGFALLFDVALNTDHHEEVLNKSAPYLKKKGVGLRIALRVDSSDTTVAASFASVAANATLKTLSVQYEVEGLGLSTDLVGELLSIDVSGPLDSASYQRIRELISVHLPKYLRGDSVAPGQYMVPVRVEQYEPLERARTINYAVSMIARKKKLVDTISERPKWVSTELLGLMYARFGAGGADGPSTVQAERANRWLTTGETP